MHITTRGLKLEEKRIHAKFSLSFDKNTACQNIYVYVKKTILSKFQKIDSILKNDRKGIQTK